MIHVAILQQPYLQYIIDGRKTVEIRLTRTRRAPFQKAAKGQRIYFKQSGGPFRATAIVRSARFISELTPQKILTLRESHNERIMGTDEFWKSRSRARFLSLLTFTDVEKITAGPRMNPHHGVAWQCLPDEADVYPACLNTVAESTKQSVAPPPLADSATPTSRFPIQCTLTHGNLKHHHVYLNDSASLFPVQCQGGSTRAQAGEPITLEFDDGSSAQTDLIAAHQRFRIRAPWGRWFAARQAQPGDIVVIERQSHDNYRVSLQPK